MVQCHSRLPLAVKLQRRSTLAGCFVNALSVTMLAVYMTIVFPPEEDATIMPWVIAVPLFALPDLAASTEFALEEAITTALAGLSTSAAVYLTSEWQLRPPFALALDRSAPPEARSLGIGPRLLLTWV